MTIFSFIGIEFEPPTITLIEHTKTTSVLNNSVKSTSNNNDISVSSVVRTGNTTISDMDNIIRITTIITSSMINDVKEDSITVNFINPTVNDTRAFKYTSKKNTKITVIFASAFGSLLVLCFVLCTVALILKCRHRRKHKIETRIFTLSVVNPIMER